MKLRLSICRKLLGPIVGSIALVVGGLTIYFTSQQIETIRDGLRDKARRTRC